MLEFIRKAPFIRIVIPFVSGILLRLYFPISYPIATLFIFITFIFLIGSVILNKINKGLRNQWFFGLTVVLCFLFSGIALTSVRLNSIKPKINENFCGYILCSIKDLPEVKERSIRCLVNVEKCFTQKEAKIVDQKAYVYFRKNEGAKKLGLGDVVLIKASIDRIKSNGNPYEFDYGKYYEKQGIYYRIFSDSASWRKVKSNDISAIRYFIISGRQRIIDIFKQIGLTGNELSVALSLTIGYKTDLDSEVRQAFSSTGTMHILAVSGMHVGLIYLILCFFLAFCDRFKYGKVIKAIIIITLIWIYALLSGMPASVFRASLMLTFFALGIIAKRALNPFNSIGISAFIILLIDPLQISDVGFQLSYMAVIGIITMYPILYNWLKTGSRLFDPVLALLAVSFAAQVGTAPLSLFYFHQFPNYFLLTNLLVVPFSTIIIYFSILLFAFSGWNCVLLFLGKIFGCLIKFLNTIVVWFDGFPYITTNNITLQPTQVILLYACIGLVYFFYIYRKAYFITVLLIFINLTLIAGWIAYYKESRTSTITFYNSPKHTLVQFKWGLKNIWIADEWNESNNRILSNTLQNSIWKDYKMLILDSVLNSPGYSEKHCPDFPLISGNRTIKFLDKTMLIGINNRFSDHKKIDYLIIPPDEFIPSGENLTDNGKNIVFIGNIPKKLDNTLIKGKDRAFEKAGSFVYCLCKQGALQISIKQYKN
jgi:competence protein ComEC